MVNNGVLVDYWVAPHVKTSLGGGIDFVVDMANKTAAIPGSGDTPLVFTYSLDIVVGDRVTWNQVLAREVRGSKFMTTHDSFELLQTKKVTELPSHQTVYRLLLKEMVQSICAAVGISSDQGHCDMNAEKTLNEQFPSTETRKIKELVAET